MPSEISDTGHHVAPMLLVSEEEARKRPAPSEPPQMLLSGGGEVPAIAATLSAADWSDLASGFDIPVPEESIDWPEPVKRRGRTTIEFAAESEPFWFDVVLGTQVDPESGLPVDPATGKEFPLAHEFQCRVGGRVDGEMRHEN